MYTEVLSSASFTSQWQLIEISKPIDETDELYTNTQSVKDQRIYWAFQLDLLNIYTQLDNLNGYTSNTVARFKHENGELSLPSIYIHFHNRDSLLADPLTTTLESVGIKGNQANFQVERLDSKKMILKSSYNRLVFRRF